MRRPASVGSLHQKCSRSKENKLIDLAIKGDKQAFSYLYQNNYSQIYSFCTRMLKSRCDVEDAVQLVFLEAWRSLYRFERRSLFSTWITKIAIHICLGFYRKSGRVLLSTDDNRDLYQETTEVLWGTAILTPDDELRLSTRKDTVNKIIKKLSYKKQIVYFLSEIFGMTAPEIAEMLKIPDATVRTRLFHARREITGLVLKNPLFKEPPAKSPKQDYVH